MSAPSASARRASSLITSRVASSAQCTSSRTTIVGVTARSSAASATKTACGLSPSSTLLSNGPFDGGRQCRSAGSAAAASRGRRRPPRARAPRRGAHHRSSVRARSCRCRPRRRRARRGLPPPRRSRGSRASAWLNATRSSRATSPTVLGAGAGLSIAASCAPLRLKSSVPIRAYRERSRSRCRGSSRRPIGGSVRCGRADRCAEVRLRRDGCGLPANTRRSSSA